MAFHEGGAQADEQIADAPIVQRAEEATLSGA